MFIMTDSIIARRLSTALVVFVILCVPLVFGRSVSTQEQEAEPETVSVDRDPLPECSDASSVCGYVQLNHMGVSSERICRCPGLGPQSRACPLSWNPFDGQTIMHGLDQYKYCGRAPSVPTCDVSPPTAALPAGRSPMVYSSYMEMTEEGEMLANVNLIHCKCPARNLFVQNSTLFDELPSGVSVIATTYQCRPPPVCSASDVCMSVTSSNEAGSSFTTRNCACPRGRTCPYRLSLAASKLDLARGSVYSMKCLPNDPTH